MVLLLHLIVGVVLGVGSAAAFLDAQMFQECRDIPHNIFGQCELVQFRLVQILQRLFFGGRSSWHFVLLLPDAVGNLVNHPSGRGGIALSAFSSSLCLILSLRSIIRTSIAISVAIASIVAFLWFCLFGWSFGEAGTGGSVLGALRGGSGPLAVGAHCETDG